MLLFGLEFRILAERSPNRDESGISGVEALVAIAILGIVGAVFITGISTTYRSGATADRQSIALTLAQSQLEDIESQYYQPVPSGQSQIAYASPIAVPSGTDYKICSYDSSNQIVENSIIGVPWDSTTGLPVTPDANLQRIKLAIKKGSDIVLTLETYKRNR